MKTLAYHILDITENSYRAGASEVKVQVEEDPAADTFIIDIIDNGKGIEKEVLHKTTNPFFTSRNTRKVGLGIPLFQQNALQSKGKFNIQSKPGKGTHVHAVFGFSNIDRPPAGDLPGIIITLAAKDDSVHLVYQHYTPKGEFTFDSAQIKETLEGLPLSHPQIRNSLKEMIRENLKDIQAENSK